MIKLSDVKEGDFLIPDSSFTCCVPNKAKKVHKDNKNGGLYFYCGHGMHYLDGQDDGKGNLVGLTKAHRHE